MSRLVDSDANSRGLSDLFTRVSRLASATTQKQASGRSRAAASNTRRMTSEAGCSEDGYYLGSNVLRYFTRHRPQRPTQPTPILKYRGQMYMLKSKPLNANPSMPFKRGWCNYTVAKKLVQIVSARRCCGE